MEDAYNKEINPIRYELEKILLSSFPSIQSSSSSNIKNEFNKKCIVREKPKFKLFTRSIFHKFQSTVDDSSSIHDFLKLCIKKKLFKSARTVHLFLHEKGKRRCHHIETSAKIERVRNISSAEFNSLYLSIKKSKNRSFGNSELRGLNFEIIGTFIGHEFSLNKYNIVIIFSRDDFLPQTSSEIDYFHYIFQIMPLFIEQVLLFDHHHNHDSILTNYLKIISSISHEEADIYHSERVNLLGELLNTLRHELSNPLFGLNLSTQILTGEITDPDYVSIVKDIQKSALRCQNIISNFSTLFSSDTDFIKLELHKLIDETIILAKSEIKGIQLERDYDHTNERIVSSHPTWLSQVVFNIIINAAQELKDHNRQNPIIKVSTKFKSNSVVIKISDNGRGIPEDKIGSIFSPFYTTKENGTGLGLSICKNLVQKLNGDIRVQNEANGLAFIIEVLIK